MIDFESINNLWYSVIDVPSWSSPLFDVFFKEFTLGGFAGIPSFTFSIVGIVGSAIGVILIMVLAARILRLFI